MRTDRIIEIINLLLNANYERMTREERREFIILRKKMRPIAEEAEKDQKDAEDTLKPQVMKDVQEGKVRFDSLTDEQKARADAEVANYWRELAEVMRPVMEKEQDIEFPKLSAEAFDRFMEVNPKWTGAQTDALIEAFGVEYD